MPSHKPVIPAPASKYLFDRHDFGASAIPVETEELPPPPPPPPTFSEAELEAARANGFEEGRRTALSEAAASRDQVIATLLESIHDQLGSFAASEEDRRQFFERESVIACLAVLEAVLPTLADHCSWSEIERVLQETLKQLSNTSSVAITVPADCLDAVRSLMERGRVVDDNTNIILRAGEEMEAGSCRIEWETGGAVRDSAVIFQKTLEALRHVLALPSKTADNELRDPLTAIANET